MSLKTMCENTGNIKPYVDQTDGEKTSNTTVSDTNLLKRTRRRLQERFDMCQCRGPNADKRFMQKTWSSFSLPNMTVPRIHASRVLRSSANTLTKTLNSMQTTLGSLSQKFRRSTRRRYQLRNESPCSQLTPQTRSRRILGRTPTKLYSPFGIDSPCKKIRGKENENTPRRVRSERKSVSSCGKPTILTGNAPQSQQKNFDPDMEEVRIGIWELRQTANRIVKRALKQ